PVGVGAADGVGPGRGLLDRLGAEDLLARPGSKAAVLAKAGLRPEDPVDANGVASLWDVFAPGRPLPSVTADLIVREAGAAPEWDAPLYFFCRPAVLEAI
ncbi:MAG: hypothetical protein AAFU79_22915, partial [Myxococcota bacterium]